MLFSVFYSTNCLNNLFLVCVCLPSWWIKIYITMFSCFPPHQEDGKRSKIFGNDVDGCDGDDAEFDTLWNCWLPVTVSEICKFWPWPTISRSSVTSVRWLDRVRLIRWILDEIRLNGVRNFQRFFSCFPGDAFSIWKMESKLCGYLHSCRILFIELEYLDENSQTILE